MKLTLGKFRELTAHLPDDIVISYHAYYKGCCLKAYQVDKFWLYPKDQEPTQVIVINPSDDYDPR